MEAATFSGEPGKAREGSRRVRSSFSYDGMGNLVESIYFDNNGSITTKRIATYSQAGVKTEETTFKSKGSLSSRRVFVPDGSSRVIEIDEYDDKGQVTSKTFFSYDGAGKLVEKRNQGKSGEESATRYKHDPQGQLVEQTSFDDKGNLTGKIVYSYAPDLTRVESTTYKDQVSVHNVVRIQNARMRGTEISLYRKDGVMAWQRNFTYDDKGNVVSDEYKSEAFYAKWDYAYALDDTANWTRQTKSRWYNVSGKPALVPEETLYRSFSYYPKAYTRPALTPVILEESQSSYALGGVLQGAALRRVEPVYPTAAKVQQASGTVVVEVTVDEEGNVTKPRIVSGMPVFHDSSLSAASKWKFVPTLASGLPVKVVGTVTFNFNL